jgi:hypothetical protein
MPDRPDAPRPGRITWPDGKAFALTVVDDTDCSTVANAGPVYEALAELGLRTTKTVWPLNSIGTPFTGGSSLEDPEYRRWVLDLQAQGFEIALHGVADDSSTRERIALGLDRFREILGHDPRVHANHLGQIDALYWGSERLDGLPRRLYQLVWALKGRDHVSLGHVPGSPHFWGDLCRERITYVRNFAFRAINTLKSDPLMPYHDPRRPLVRRWFSASDGAHVPSFLRLLSEANQDRLAEEGGACIVYTHFGVNFARDGRLHPEVARLLRRLAGLPGWFVPASTLLDHIGAARGWGDAGQNRRALARLQRRWLMERLRHGAH